MIEKLQSKKVNIVILGIILAVLIGLTIFFAKEKVVASVDGESIKKEELYSVLVEQYGTDALDALIADKITALEAKKEKITVTEEEKVKELKELMESYGGEDPFNSALESSGVTLDNVKEDVEQYLITKKLLESRISITEEEMKVYFEENKNTYAQSKQVRASHILVEDLDTAKSIEEKLADGEEFAKLAKKYSTDTSSAENGGDLDYFSEGEMVTEFEEVAFSMDVGEISEPIKTDYGYHIINVTGKKDAVEAKYVDHKEEIKETLFEQELQTEYTSWLEEKKGDYEIKNYISKDE